jgi:hypothetical protein
MRMRSFEISDSKGINFSAEEIMEREAIPSIDSGGFWQLNDEENTDWASK